MSRDEFPTRASALLSLIQDEISRRADGLLRVECAPPLHLEGLSEALAPLNARLAALSPNSLWSGADETRATSSAKVATSWRNEPIESRRARPIVLFGRASGRDEAGLKRVRPITERELIKRYQELGLKWLKARAREEGARPERLKAQLRFFQALVSLTTDSELELEATSALFAETFSSDKLFLLDEDPAERLWMLGLLSDDGALDDPQLGARLSLNVSYAKLLKSPPLSSADQRRWDLIHKRALAGDESCKRSITLLNTGRREHLRGVQLSSIRAALTERNHAPQAERGPGGAVEEPAPSLRALRLHEALDEGLWPQPLTLDLERPQLKLKLTAFDPSEPSRERELTLQLSADGGSPELLGLASVARPGRLRRDLTLEELLEGAPRRAHRALAELAERGERLRALAPWSGELLSLCLLDEALTEELRELQRRWASLEPLKGATLPLLGADWTLDERGRRSGALRAWHPTAIKPALELADWARQRAGHRGLGSTLAWAQERLALRPRRLPSPTGSPALRSLPGEPLKFSSAELDSPLPRLTSSRGLLSVARSYLGFSPYAELNLSLLIVDPTGGSALLSALRELSRVTRRLTVYVAHTAPMTSELLAELPSAVDLGLISTAEAALEVGARFHLTLAFTSADERRALWFAALTDWLCLLSPSWEPLISPSALEGLSYLGREPSGPYQLSVYTADASLVRRQIQAEVISSPTLLSERALEARLVSLARRAPRGLLPLGRGERMVSAQLAQLCAIDALTRSSADPQLGAHVTAALSTAELPWLSWLSSDSAEARAPCELIVIKRAEEPSAALQLELIVTSAPPLSADGAADEARSVEALELTLSALEALLTEPTEGEELITRLAREQLCELINLALGAQLSPERAEALHTPERLLSGEALARGQVKLSGAVIIVDKTTRSPRELRQLKRQGLVSISAARLGAEALRGLLEER